MKFEYKINENEFIKLKFFLTYRKTITIISHLLFVIFLLRNLRNLIVFNRYSGFDIFVIIMSIYFLFIAPLIYYFRFRKEYRSNKLLQQKVISEITDENIIDISDETKAEVSWNTVNRVEETKFWFLFYYSNDMYGLSPKRSMTKDQILELREIIKKKNIKSKLKVS